jgi:uncharacterized protein
MGESNLSVLIKNMRPVLHEGEFVFCSLPNASFENENIIFCFKEREGITTVCTRAYAVEHQYAFLSVFAWITLDIHSSLEAVGLTAAFAHALAQKHISCNVVAGFYHDHLFVQHEKATLAIQVLHELSLTV